MRFTVPIARVFASLIRLLGDFDLAERRLAVRDLERSKAFFSALGFGAIQRIDDPEPVATATAVRVRNGKLPIT